MKKPPPKSSHLARPAADLRAVIAALARTASEMEEADKAGVGEMADATARAHIALLGAEQALREVWMGNDVRRRWLRDLALAESVELAEVAA